LRSAFARHSFELLCRFLRGVAPTYSREGSHGLSRRSRSDGHGGDQWQPAAASGGNYSFDGGTRAGIIELDTRLLQAGRFALGVIQHEYAHQVDFFLLDDAMRARPAGRLGGESWWQTSAGFAHQALTSERFASSLAWAYWPSPDNAPRPTSTADEAGALAPADVRLLLGDVLGVGVPSQHVVAAARRR
jgi:hypothetical protein